MIGLVATGNEGYLKNLTHGKRVIAKLNLILVLLYDFAMELEIFRQYQKQVFLIC